MKKILLATTVLMFAAAPVFAGGKGNAVTKDNNTGAVASAAAHDLGGVGEAIGGLGNSGDGDNTDGQAHDGDGTRGDKMQEFLADRYDIGSESD